MGDQEFWESVDNNCDPGMSSTKRDTENNVSDLAIYSKSHRGGYHCRETEMRSFWKRLRQEIAKMQTGDEITISKRMVPDDFFEMCAKG